ncbi:MAG: ROK family protein [Anaerolineae bacterium]|nr:ROK family protein [Anaerolineae bacterium]
MMTAPHFIGLDLGGTRIRTGRFSPELNLLARSETQTRDEEGIEPVIRRMVEQVQAVLPTDGARVAGVGVSAPGPIDPINGVITTPPNLQGWKNIPLRDILRERLGLPVYLGNDANLAALAEHRMGAGRGYGHVIYLTISTGIGSGVIIGGEMLLGSAGLASEAGHLIMAVDGEQVTTLEKEAAGPALARQAVRALRSGQQSVIRDLAGGDLDAVTGRMIGEAAEAGDALALSILRRAGTMIGLGVLSLLHCFNPEIVVIGGGVALNTWQWLIDPLWDAIRAHAMGEAFWQNVKIVQAQLGDDVALIGAATLASVGAK